MYKKVPISETAIELANRIEQKIRIKKPAPGTPVKKTKAIAKEYGVSTSCANLAMRLLVQRRLIQRRPRAGTFIADFQRLSASPAAKINFMMPGTGTGIMPELLTDMILGVQSVFPTAEIIFTYYENDAEGGGGGKEINEIIKDNAGQALVLVRAPLKLQRLVSESGLPAIVLGHPFPTVKLPWIDADSIQQGALAAECVLKQHDAPVLLMIQNRIAPGDQLFMDGFKKKLHAAQRNLFSVTEQFVPLDTKVIEHTVKEYLCQQKGRCCIIASMHITDTVLKKIKQLKETKRVYPISIRGINCKLTSADDCTVIDWNISLYEFGEKLGKLLLRRITTNRTGDKTVLSPRIVFPSK